MTVSTIYAVAQCGFVTSNSNVTWATVRDSTTGNTASPSPTTMLTHARFFSSAHTLYQSFLQFDTSVVTGVVTAPATLYLYAASIAGSDVTDGQSVFTVYDFGTSITTADLLSRSEMVALGYYGSIGWPEFGVGYYGGSSESLATYAQDNNTTRVAVVPARQFTDTPPAGDNYVVWGATSGSDGDPYMTVQWGIVTGTAGASLTSSRTVAGLVSRYGSASFNGQLTATMFKPGTYYGSAAASLGFTPSIHGYVQERNYYRRLTNDVMLTNEWTRYSSGILGGASTTADPTLITPSAARYLKPAFELNKGGVNGNVSRISDITLKQLPDETQFSGIQPSAIVGVSGDVVGTGGAQLISGYKTFQMSPIILNQPVNNTDAVNKLYVDNAISAASTSLLDLVNPTSGMTTWTPGFYNAGTDTNIPNPTSWSKQAWYQTLNSKWIYVVLNITITGSNTQFPDGLSMSLPVAPSEAYVISNISPGSTMASTSISTNSQNLEPIFGAYLNYATYFATTARKGRVLWFTVTSNNNSLTNNSDGIILKTGSYPLSLGSSTLTIVSRFVYRYA